MARSSPGPFRHQLVPGPEPLRTPSSHVILTNSPPIAPMSVVVALTVRHTPS